MKINKDECFSFFIFLLILHSVNAQEESLFVSVPRSIRIIWTGNEFIWRYSVEIEKMEDEAYKNFLQEYTTTSYLNVSVLPGIYRYRIIPYDILDRPGEGTQWVNFEIYSSFINNMSGSEIDAEQINNFGTDDLREAQISESRHEADASFEHIILQEIELPNEKNEQLIASEIHPSIDETIINSPRYNTLCFSAGTAFTDPLVIFSLQGTYAPINNFFIKLGCDFGFVSEYEGVENFYSLYPYVNLGYFLPFRNMGGVFAGAGIGYIFGSYQFSHGGKAGLGIFAVNVTAGMNIIDVINISYSFRTDFAAVNHQIAVGYVYRFKQK